MKYTRNLLFNTIYHRDWYMCEEELPRTAITVQGTMALILDYYNGQPHVLRRCTFIARPILASENKFKNCKNVVGPIEAPKITGQHLPHPPHLVQHTPPPAVVQPSCMPVCPTGAMGGVQEGPASTGTSAVTTISQPEISSVSIPSRRKWHV